MKKSACSDSMVARGENGESERRIVRTRRLVYGLSAIVSAMASATIVKAQNYWNQPAGGSWENPANWSLGHVPEGEGVAFAIPSAPAYAVAMTASQRPAGISVQNNSVTINASAGNALVDGLGLDINASAGAVSSFTFNGSSVDGTDGSIFSTINLDQSENDLMIGGAGATYFTLNNTSYTNRGEPFTFGPGSSVSVNNSVVDSAVNVLGNATFNASSSLPTDYIYGIGYSVDGVGKAAVLNLINGASFTDASLVIGSTPLDLAQPGAGIVNVTNSRFLGSLTDVGGTGGEGILNISNGGYVSGTEFDLGVEPSVYRDDPPGMGSLSVEGAGSLVVASQVIAVGSTSAILFSSGGKATTPALNLSSGSTLGITLDDPDAIAVSGLATLAGTLDITLGTAADPLLGQSYDLLTFTTESGSFSTIDLPPLDPGLAWSTQNLYTNGTILVVAAVPEPASAALLLAASAMPLSRRCRRCLQ